MFKNFILMILMLVPSVDFCSEYAWFDWGWSPEDLTYRYLTLWSDSLGDRFTREYRFDEKGNLLVTGFDGQEYILSGGQKKFEELKSYFKREIDLINTIPFLKSMRASRDVFCELDKSGKADLLDHFFDLKTFIDNGYELNDGKARPHLEFALEGYRKELICFEDNLVVKQQPKRKPLSVKFIKNDSIKTPLIILLSKDSLFLEPDFIEILKKVLNMGGKQTINWKTYKGKTALHVAMLSILRCLKLSEDECDWVFRLTKCLMVVEILLKNNADPNSLFEDRFGHLSPLMLFFTTAHYEFEMFDKDQPRLNLVKAFPYFIKLFSRFNFNLKEKNEYLADVFKICEFCDVSLETLNALKEEIMDASRKRTPTPRPFLAELARFGTPISFTPAPRSITPAPWSFGSERSASPISMSNFK
ncbi:MAG: hypothetical protein UR26_C0001G0220 [candidate division TM6 bacterium GW2011_GWF2_32_72]|nr:MAG: hypothetical protein UR26_C0001G0220 [candidate division TM6 bacterium GW2011_GWF2_32_72]